MYKNLNVIKIYQLIILLSNAYLINVTKIKAYQFF